MNNSLPVIQLVMLAPDSGIPAISDREGQTEKLTPEPEPETAIAGGVKPLDGRDPVFPARPEGYVGGRMASGQKPGLPGTASD